MREALKLAFRAGNDGNACSVSCYFCVVVRAKLVCSRVTALAYIYSNSKMVAATRDADELKMLAWDHEDAQRQCDRK